MIGRRKRLAFTLVEILICIAIIAILAALSFAGMRSVVAHAKESNCIQNQRQLALATLSYRSDNNEGWPLGPGVSVLLKSGHLVDKRILVCPSDLWKQGVASYDTVRSKPGTTEPYSYFSLFGLRDKVAYLESRNIEFSLAACILHGTRTKEFSLAVSNPDTYDPVFMVEGRVVGVRQDSSLIVRNILRGPPAGASPDVGPSFSLYQILIGRDLTTEEVKTAWEEFYGHGANR